MSASQFEAFLRKSRRLLEPVNWHLAAALFISIIAAWPLLSDPGFLNTRGGGDSPFLLQRVQQLGLALADGHFPVRWMPDASYGYGYPFFNYYAPLSIYIASALDFLGFGLVWAIKITQLLGFIAAAWSMFALGKRWFRNDWAGLLTSAAYTLAPFHMVNVYVRGDSLAEFWAMAFYPVIIYLADTLVREATARSRKRMIRAVLLLGLSYAAVILSHNISALIFTPFLLLYVLLVTVVQSKGNRLSTFLWTCAALAVGLALSSWFWLPALAEQSYAQLDPVTSGYFHFENHFRSIDLVQQSFAFDYDVVEGKSFAMGLLQTILALVGMVSIAYYAWKKHKRAPDSSNSDEAPSLVSTLFIAISLIIATIMITALSRPLWENLPLLSFAQFPWRFLSIQAFAAALAAGGIALLPWRKVVVPVVILVLIAVSLAGLDPDFLDIGDEDITAKNLAEYEWFTGNIGSTVSAEYLPRTVIPRPFTSAWINEGARDSVQVLAGEINSISALERLAARQTWSVEVVSPEAEIAFPTLQWPGWKAKVDEEDVEIAAAYSSGMIVLEIPAGLHQVELKLTRTPVRWIAEIISLVFAIVVIILLVWSRSERLRWKNTLATAGIALLILVIVWVWPAAARTNDDLSWDFLQLAYLHHGDEGISFDDGSVLESYSYDKDELPAGENLEITLQWQELQGSDASIELVSPAANRFKNTPVVAGQMQGNGSQEVTYTLKIPDNAPAGMHIPRLVVEGASAITSSGSSRGDLFLRPILIHDILDSSAADSSTLDARAVQVYSSQEGVLEVQLQWLTNIAQTINYNYSLRIVDTRGIELAQIDSQPGYGFLPSSLWMTGQWIDDWISLGASSSLKESNENTPYSLVVRLYDTATGQVALIRRLGELDWRGEGLTFAQTEPSYAKPSIATEIEVSFGEQIKLLGYDEVVSGDQLNLVLHWQALVDGLDDYYQFAHLIDPVSGEILAQHDGMPRFETYPTSQWSAGEFVSDPAFIDLTDIPPGSYQIAIGLYQRLVEDSCVDCLRRLIAVDSDGNQLLDDRLLLPQPIIISR